MTTCPDRFHRLHLAACDSTNDFLRRHLGRLEADFPLMVSADAQSAGRGRENRAWVSPGQLGIYATFGFHLPDGRGLSLLSLASGVAAAGMLESWTGKAFALKWPNDILADGKKIAGVLCETIVNGEKVICLVGIGINVNHDRDDFPAALRERAGSLKLLTGAEWPLPGGRERLEASMASWLQKLIAGQGPAIIDRARQLSRPFIGRGISFHSRGEVINGTFLDIAADGGLRLGLDGGGQKTFYSGEMD